MIRCCEQSDEYVLLFGYRFDAVNLAVSQFRISRSPAGTLFVFQRIDDVEDIFNKMGLPKRGGSTWSSFFG